MVTRNVLIVGSGAAAWMTAAHLNAVLNRDGRRFANISVAGEAEDGQPGVGEATLPDISRLISLLGVNQLEFMRRTGATLRHAGKFVNWLDNTGEYFYHTVSGQRPGTVDKSAIRWLQSNRSIPFAETVSAQPQLAEMNLAPLMAQRWDFGPPLPYSFHVDVARLRDYLAERTMAAGVVRHSTGPKNVEMTESGDIAAVVLDNGERLEADLFIDCTDDAALIGRCAPGAAWVDCSQWLPADRVLAMDVPYGEYYPGAVRPYTTATAVSSGWIGEVPLQDRRSLRYVYSSQFQEDDAAEQELRRFEGPHAGSLATTTVSLQTGRRENAWVGNCVAIGAAAGVMDPLEPTTLYMVDHAAAMLTEHFPLGEAMAPLAFRYNRIMANRFYELLDFANLHYCLSQRSDTEFWRAMTQADRMTDRLQAKLEFWRAKPPAATDFEDQFLPGQSDAPLAAGRLPGDYRSPIDTAGLWDHQDYECVLYGMGFLTQECDARYGADRPDPTVLALVAEQIRLAPQKLPTHEAWLQQVCGMPDYRAMAGSPVR